MRVKARCVQCNTLIETYSPEEFKDWLDAAVDWSASHNKGADIAVMCPRCAAARLDILTPMLNRE